MQTSPRRRRGLAHFPNRYVLLLAEGVRYNVALGEATCIDCFLGIRNQLRNNGQVTLENWLGFCVWQPTNWKRSIDVILSSKVVVVRRVVYIACSRGWNNLLLADRFSCWGSEQILTGS